MTEERCLLDDGSIKRLDGPEILFKRSELACKATGEVVLHPGFATQLAWLRMCLGKPMYVTSCCRSSTHNAAVGGHPRSLHVYDVPHHGAKGTLAIDIARGEPKYNYRLVQLALANGWSVGISKTFIHLDKRTMVDLPENIFGY